MNVHWIAKKDSESIAEAASQWLIQQIGVGLERRDRYVLAVAGGSTPRRLYQMLSEVPEGRVDWHRVHVVWGDERLVPLDHPDSNFEMVRTAFLDPLGRSGPNVYPVPIDLEDPNRTADYYESTLKNLLGNQTEGGWPRFDLVLLGLGEDAHTASLFPGSPGLAEHHRWVLSHWIEKLNSFRITLSAPAINMSRNVAFLISGSGKRHALENVLHGERNPGLFPAQLIRPSHGDLWWFVDDEAAAGLEPPIESIPSSSISGH